mgnify:CR=1 FL=1
MNVFEMNAPNSSVIEQVTKRVSGKTPFFNATPIECRALNMVLRLYELEVRAIQGEGLSHISFILFHLY